MASLNWTWGDYWNWFRQIETKEEKTTAMKELLGNGWLKNLSAESQAEVMRDAPWEILSALKHLPEVFKPETLRMIQIYIDKKNMPVRRRR